MTAIKLENCKTKTGLNELVRIWFKYTHYYGVSGVTNDDENENVDGDENSSDNDNNSDNNHNNSDNLFAFISS